MEFRFDAKQEFQTKAVESIARIFDGQGRIESTIRYAPKAGFLGSPNHLDLTEDDLLRNLQLVQQSNGLEISPNLQFIEKEVETADGKKQSRFPNFSVEMETGTGKTYVYIRTAFELNKRYGFRRFIIVVPSVAVKEGVLKSFEITEKHFRELYGNVPCKFYSYDSSNLTQVRQFASSSNIEFMVMTLDSFNKALTDDGKGNVIRRPTDRLQGATPIHLVQASKPVLFLDEPQNMESENSVAALAALDPLLALRYSATHRNPYNLVYRLTPADAFRQGLVKKIEVASVIKEDDVNQVFIQLEGVESKKNKVTASLLVNKLMKPGIVKPKSVTVRLNDNLLDKTNLPEYESFTVEEINPGSQTITFGNGIQLQVGEARGADKEAVFEAQVRYTIEEHFRKQRRLKPVGLKVLSLFFIDRVDNYLDNGLIHRLFTRSFDELRERYPEWKTLDSEEVQASYFAFTKKRGGEKIYEDSVSGETEKDKETYDLIMKDKERLLSFDSKVSFVFSHSALREGWDNPNVFQICTLNQTASEIKKRQEIGRGARLAVDQSGERIHNPQVNLLTVVANQSYVQYVSQLQNEMVAEYGEGEELPPKPANARTRKTVSLRKEFVLKDEFKELWNRIRDKTRYSVTIDTIKLVKETVQEVDRIPIKPPRIVVAKAALKIDSEGAFKAMEVSNSKTFVDLAGRFPLPNLADIMTHLLENTTPPVRLSRRTLVEIFLRTENKEAAMDNPFEFASVVVQVLKEKLADHLVNGIQYEKINAWYEMTQLVETFEAWEDYAVPTQRSVYDNIECDSDVERRFIEGLEKNEQVRMYIKLPSWFKVRTPVGEYNPDWAIIWEQRDEHGHQTSKPLLYLVRETKNTTKISELRPDERRKIVCGRKHFKDALGTDYDVVTSTTDMFPNKS